MLKDPSSEKLVAIELELHAKSSYRYREIVGDLRSSRRLVKVIYVTPNEAIDLKIMSEIMGHPVVDKSIFKTSFFEFLKLDECLNARSPEG